MNPEMTNSTGTDPLKQCMATLDQLIQAGGASAEDLQNLKMDMEDAMGGGGQEAPAESPNPSDMGGMIDNMQRGA